MRLIEIDFIRYGDSIYLCIIMLRDKYFLFPKGVLLVNTGDTC